MKTVSSEYRKGYEQFPSHLPYKNSRRKLSLKEFDVIVVGAGTGGCMTAKTLAEAGLEVCLIDRKRREDIGEKVCGDAIAKHHLDDLGLEYPKGEELESRISGVKIYSPDKETVFKIKGERVWRGGFILNRRLFGQRLLRQAEDAGATLLDSTHVIEPIFRDGFVVGVLVRNVKTAGRTQLQAKVVVDASGYTAVLRNKLPPEMGIEQSIRGEDVEACYREIREIKEPFPDPEFGEIYLDLSITPGGYHWIFPEGENKVNVGLGVAMCPGFPNPKNQLYQRVLTKPLFKGSRVLTGGAWYDPTRRPLDCMVGNGIVFVGDAACQVNPVHGGGMGPSMRGGKIAAESIVEALEKGDVSREGLWHYNTQYMTVYGAKQAGVDMFKIFLLRGVSNDDLNYGMKYKIVTEEDIFRVSIGENLRLNITDKTKRVFRGAGRLSLLRRLRNTANLLKEMKTLYMNYPASPSSFSEWKKKTQELIETAGKRLSKK